MSSRQTCFFVAGSLLVLILLGCGYGSNSMVSGAIPNVTQLMPNAVAHGSADFPMTVNGNNFGANAVVYFNGNPLQTAYGSTMQVMAQVPATDVTASGMVNVYVRSGGQNSNMVVFTIQ